MLMPKRVKYRRVHRGRGGYGERRNGGRGRDNGGRTGERAPREGGRK